MIEANASMPGKHRLVSASHNTAIMACDTRKDESTIYTDEKAPQDTFAQIVRTISNIGMSPIASTDVDRRLGLLMERPQGENKIDRIECVCVLPYGQGELLQFQPGESDLSRVLSSWICRARQSRSQYSDDMLLSLS